MVQRIIIQPNNHGFSFEPSLIFNEDSFITAQQFVNSLPYVHRVRKLTDIQKIFNLGTIHSFKERTKIEEGRFSNTQEPIDELFGLDDYVFFTIGNALSNQQERWEPSPKLLIKPSFSTERPDMIMTLDDIAQIAKKVIGYNHDVPQDRDLIKLAENYFVFTARYGLNYLTKSIAHLYGTEPERYFVNRRVLPGSFADPWIGYFSPEFKVPKSLGVDEIPAIVVYKRSEARQLLSMLKDTDFGQNTDVFHLEGNIDDLLFEHDQSKFFYDVMSQYRSADDGYILFEVYSKLVKKSEGFADTRNGSGLVIYCPETEELLMLHRSKHVLFPYSWGVSYGAIKYLEEGDEDPLVCAVTEASEELGGLPIGRIRSNPHVYEFRPNSYSNLFILEVSKSERERFIPKLNWEHTEAMWVQKNQLNLDTCHPNIKELVENYTF